MTTEVLELASWFIVGMTGLYYVRAQPHFLSQGGNLLLSGVDILLIVGASYRLPIASDVTRSAIAAIAITLPAAVVMVWRWARERRRTAAHH
ncbi:hypothetical protein [Schleiferilactobacillus harbinensis]|jgi:hypothetical protein|uniref:Uncharacterized protein n=1 Tax=Schleiferilactobacillus harbinensis TaxID=304207 RepID=A0ABU7T186_9LACO